MDNPIKIHCNLCNQDTYKVIYPSTIKNNPNREAWKPFRCTNPGYGSHYTIVKCNNCSLMYVNPRITSEQILANYVRVEDPTYLVEQIGRELTFQKHLAELHKITGIPAGRKILDVGSYTGVFVSLAGKAGWNAFGVEPSKWAVEQAAKSGLNITEGTLESANFPKNNFDVITMWDVIEHLDDPYNSILSARTLLKKDGLLVIHTMDVDSLAAKILGKRWPWLMEMHIYYFSQRTMSEMLKKAGFEIIKSGPQGRYVSYVLSSLSRSSSLSILRKAVGCFYFTD